MFGVIRPGFLLLTPACVLLGIAAGVVSGGEPDWFALGPVLLGAIAAHAAVNALNEVSDFHSGLDFKTQRTPFSGGSGTLIAHPQLANAALGLGIACVLVTLACGAWLIDRVGRALLPFGVIGLALVVLYSGPISRNRFAISVAPGLGFGPMMVLGAEVCITGGVSVAGVWLSLVPFFLVNNLLLLNQFPDRHADRRSGRDNVVIAYGARTAAVVYGGGGLLAYLTLIGATTLGVLPAIALTGLLTAPLMAWVTLRALRFTGDVQPLLPAMAGNVVVSLFTPVLIAVPLLIAA
ncbi:UbiA prenyltransferase family protein [Luminiphilus syltensis NOR5-1B]|uniref:UbiA prenyltransferase family protein n=1 Tax=Luminiphilus syltensis NOR5-1B TaxID=565045 RepID=B8KUX3_9GAMM|nr:UbiA prenyltransferase family protein [Luminiphilus syltensis NOR5-1B]